MDEMKMISDGEKLIINGFGGKTAVEAEGYYIKRFNLLNNTEYHESWDYGRPYPVMYPGPKSFSIEMDIRLSGEVKFGNEGVISSVFDLFTIRDLMREAERKFNQRMR